MPTSSAVLRPALLALLVGSIVPCQGVQKLIVPKSATNNSVAKSGTNNSVAKSVTNTSVAKSVTNTSVTKSVTNNSVAKSGTSNIVAKSETNKSVAKVNVTVNATAPMPAKKYNGTTANVTAPTSGKKDSGAAVQLLSKTSTPQKDPHVIVHTNMQAESKSSASGQEPHVVVVTHAHTAGNSVAEAGAAANARSPPPPPPPPQAPVRIAAPHHFVELEGVSRETLLSGMNELAKDRKQLEANDAMLQEDVQQAAVQVQTAADQLEHASQQFASDKAELVKVAEAAKASAEQAAEEKGKMKLDIDRLLRERGKFADETHKNNMKQNVRAAKGLRRAEIDNQKMVEGLRSMQERVESLTRERDAALKAVSGAHQSSIPQAEELMMKARRVDQRTDFKPKENATAANYWNAKYVATERALQNATRNAETLMTGAKMLYKSNKKLKERVTKALEENAALKEHHDDLAKAVSDETAGKNVNAWYAKEIATAAQSGADELKAQKMALQAKYDTLTKEHRVLQNYTKALHDQFKASALEGTISKGDAEKLYAELAWYKRNASVLEHTRLKLTSEAAQLFETQKKYKRELDEAHQLLQRMAPWTEAESSRPGEMHAMSTQIKSAMSAEAQMKVIQHLAQEQSAMKRRYEQVSSEKKRLEAQAAQGASEMNMKQAAGGGMMGKLAAAFRSNGAMEAKTHQLEATVEKVTEQNKGLRTKIDLLASGSQGELRQAIGLLTAENQRLTSKVERISRSNRQAQEGAQNVAKASGEAKEASNSQLAAENQRLAAEIAKVSKEEGEMTAKYASSVAAYKAKQEALETSLQAAITKAEAATGGQSSEESSATRKAIHERDEWIKSAMGLTAENVKLQAKVNGLTTQFQQLAQAQPH